MRSLSSRLVVFAALLAAAPGCGPKGVKKVTVHGTVTYKGQKLNSGILKFVGPGGAYSAASIQPDGTYIMTDVVPGETKVGVMESPSGSGSSSGEKGGAKAAPVSLPPNVREPDTSGLKYTIEPTDSELNIEIK